jgi:hypothetical protein
MTARWVRSIVRASGISLAPENDEDAGDERDDSGYNTEVESEHCNQAIENQKDRQQQHSDIFVEGHGFMISEQQALSR